MTTIIVIAESIPLSGPHSKFPSQIQRYDHGPVAAALLLGATTEFFSTISGKWIAHSKPLEELIHYRLVKLRAVFED